MHLKLKRTPGIYLAGFMGSGKSTIGRLLADHLGWDFVDLDREIESERGTSIAQIFDERGEAEFRRIETEAITAQVRLIERGGPRVVALGGGAFVQPGNFELIENHGISIWIDCPFETVLERLAAEPGERPLARDRERFRSLYTERRAGYSRADYRIEGDCAPEAAVAAIEALPLWK